MDIISLITAVIELIVKITGNKAIGESLRKKWAVFSNLPRRMADFVGRDPEKQKVHRALRGKYPIVSLEGPGGVGKSRLALQVADECYHASRWRLWPPNRARFGAFVWASDENQSLTLSSLLDTLALTLDETSLFQQPLEQKRHQVQQAIQKRPCLLVVDNFETLGEKESIQQFLKEMPSRSKVIITSRERENFAELVSIPVGELTRAEGLELIRSEARRVNLESLISLPNQSLEAFLDVTSCYPLAIKWAIGQIKQEGLGLDGVIKALQSGKADIFQRMFDRSWGLLTEDAHRLLVIFPLFSAPASLSALQAISSLGEVTSSALGQLVHMALVEASEQDLQNRRYHIHSLARAYIQKRDEFAESKNVTVQRMNDYYTRLLESYQDWRKKEVDYSLLEPEIPNLYQAMNYSLEKGQYKDAYKLFGMSTRYLFMQGSWDELFKVAQHIVDAAEKADDAPIWGHVLTWPISSIYRHRGQLNLALESIITAVEILEEHKSILPKEKHLIDAWRHRGRILHEMNQYPEAGVWLNKAYARYVEIDAKWDQLLLSINLAELDVAQNHLDEAERWCQIAKILSKGFTDQEREANIELILGQINLARSNFATEKDRDHEYCLSTALTHFEEALQIMLSLKRPDGIADASYWLAQVALIQGDKKKARKNLSDALEIYQQHGIHEKVQLVIGQLENL
jgi:tetratricopeptide (TPR) repeat protein